jgi:hypothetical protein
MSDETHPWDAAFPDDDDPLPAQPTVVEQAAARFVEMLFPPDEREGAFDTIVASGAAKGAFGQARETEPSTLTGFEAVDAYIHRQGFKPGELVVLSGPTRPRAPPIPRVRAPKPTKGSPVRRLDARQQELLAHMAVKDNLAVFTLDEHVPDWATLKKVMTTLGGTWKKGKPGGFLFPSDVDGAEVVRLAKTSGEIFDPKLVGFFPTPDALADYVVGLIDIPRGAVVLEPSAGRGALVRAVVRAEPSAHVHCFELLADNVRCLEQMPREISVTQGDFLAVEPNWSYDAAVLNPPFAGGADIAHVTHALGFVKKGGALVAIMSAGVLYRQDRAHTAFRALVDKHGGMFVENPDGSFLESGTGVRTVTLVIERVTQ